MSAILGTVIAAVVGFSFSGVGTWGPMMRTGAKPEIVKIRFSNK